MMSKPMLSVIIPIYNADKFIEHTINNIQEQSFEDYEIICVNDCSTDNTLETLYKIAENNPRLVLVNNIENLGAGLSRNAGFDLSRGKYILFLDADDEIINNNMFGEMVSELERGQYDFVKGLFVFSQNGKEVQIRNYANHFSSARVSISNKYKLLLSPPSLWVCMISKRFILENNIRFNSVKASQDVNYWFQLVYFSKKLLLINRNFIQYNYLENCDSISSIRNSKHLIETFKQSCKLFSHSDNKVKNYFESALIVHTWKFYKYNKEDFLLDLDCFLSAYTSSSDKRSELLIKYENYPGNIVVRGLRYFKYNLFKKIKLIELS